MPLQIVLFFSLLFFGLLGTTFLHLGPFQEMSFQLVLASSLFFLGKESIQYYTKKDISRNGFVTILYVLFLCALVLLTLLNISPLFYDTSESNFFNIISGPQSFLLFLIVGIGILFARYKSCERHENFFSQFFQNNFYFILFLFFVIVLLSRIYLMNGMFNPYHDEGFHILQLSSMQQGNLIPIFESGRIELRGILFNYTSYIFSFLLGIEFLTSIRLVSVLFSLAALWMIFLIIRELCNRNVALITVCIFSFNSAFIAYSILGRFYTEAFFWFLVLIYIFIIKGSTSFILKATLGIISFLSFFFNLGVMSVLLMREVIEKRYSDAMKTLGAIFGVLAFWLLVLNPLAVVSGATKSVIPSLKISPSITPQQYNFYYAYFESYGVYLLLIIPILLLIKFRKSFFFLHIDKRLIYLVFCIASILVLAIISTEWYSLRYVLNAYLLLHVIFIAGVVVLVSKLSLSFITKVPIYVLLSLVLIFGFQINASLNSAKLSYNNGYFLYNYLNQDTQTSQSILLTTSAINNEEQVRYIKDYCRDKKCILLNSDLYNSSVMFTEDENIDIYIVNQFFLNGGGYTYKKDENYYGLYSNLKYLGSVKEIQEIEEEGVHVFFLTRTGRLYDQNRGEIASYIENEYSLISKTEDVYRGNYGSQPYDSYLLFEKK